MPAGKLHLQVRKKAGAGFLTCVCKPYLYYESESFMVTKMFLFLWDHLIWLLKIVTLWFGNCDVLVGDNPRPVPHEDVYMYMILYDFLSRLLIWDSNSLRCQGKSSGKYSLKLIVYWLLTNILNLLLLP